MNAQLLLAAMLAAASAVAQAQPKTQQVFRCGPDGRTYSQTPCADGTSVDVADPRSAEQQRAALLAKQREQAQNEKDERARQARDAAAGKGNVTQIPYTAAIKAAQPPPPASAPTGKVKHKPKPRPKPASAPAQG